MNPFVNLGIWLLALFIFAVILPIMYLADELEKQANAALDDVFGGAE